MFNAKMALSPFSISATPFSGCPVPVGSRALRGGQAGARTDDLVPRNWKGLHFFRPDPSVRYNHIDALFTKQIDWELIESMLPEMLRVALSIGAGRIKPSTILRRLATYSRKNKLYFAFRELGSVVRTIFLLEYISIIDLRRTIQAATNKSEAFNLFVQWVAFGGGRLLAENTRDEHRKMIKYHHLVANLLIFHNVVTMTRALHALIAEGHFIDEEALACFSPYQTEHINRFGRYALKRDRTPEPLERIRASCACRRDPKAGGQKRLKRV